MSKFKLSVLLVILAAFSMTAMAGDKVVKRVPAGAIAFHFVLDLKVAPPPVELVGYIGFIEGVDGPLFNGEPSKDTAYFTLRLTEGTPPSFNMPVEPDPELAVTIIPPGAQFTVYYDPNAGTTADYRDWNKAHTFAQGVPIAVFEESALLDGSLNWFSNRLIDSTPIKFNGQKINFKKLVPNGVTIVNFGGGFRPRTYNDVNTFGSSAAATALAIGGKPRHKSNDDDSDD